MKELYTTRIDKTVKEVAVADEDFTMTFDDGSTLSLQSHHDQDCCEHVYADFSVMKYHAEELTGKAIQVMTLKGVENMGFLLILSSGYDSMKVFIPCYDHQNGYYSSDLSICVKGKDSTVMVDVTEMTEGDYR